MPARVPPVPDDPPGPDASGAPRPGSPTVRARGRARAVAASAGLDAVAILVFAAAGRSTHARDGGVLGLLGTAWPFLAAAGAGWLLARAWRAPSQAWPTGVVVWAAAWLGGLALRAAVGGGTATAFVVVTGLVLALLLVGRRAVGTALTRRRRRPDRPAHGR